MATNNAANYSPVQYEVQVGGALGTLANVTAGTTGQVLTGVTGGAPTFQSAGASSISITGDTGGALTSNAFTITGGTTGLTFAGAVTTETLDGTLGVANGGTGDVTFTDYAPICGGTSGTGALQSATTGFTTSGYVLTSNGGSALPSFKAPGAPVFTWNDVTGGSATVAANNGYLADKSTLTTFTLPTDNNIGDTITIVGKGTGGWKIIYGTGQNIIFGSSASTATTGNIASTNTNDVVNLVCTTASATAPIFSVVYAVGNITIV